MKAVRALRCFLLCAEPRELEDELLGSSSLPPEIAKLSIEHVPLTVSFVSSYDLAWKTLYSKKEADYSKLQLSTYATTNLQTNDKTSYSRNFGQGSLS